MLLGVFLGSAWWWLLLSAGVGAFRTRFEERGLRRGNRISGLAITGFGLLALFSWRAVSGS